MPGIRLIARNLRASGVRLPTAAAVVNIADGRYEVGATNGANVTAAAGWTNFNFAGASAGSCRISSHATDTISFSGSFAAGKIVRIGAIGQVSAGLYAMQYQIDGGAWTSLDGPAGSNSQVWYTTAALSAGTHTIAVRKGSGTSGANGFVDYFEVA